MSTEAPTSNLNISALVIALAFVFPAFVALFFSPNSPIAGLFRPTSKVAINLKCADIGPDNGPHSLKELIHAQTTQWASNWNNEHYKKVIINVHCSSTTTNQLFEDDLHALIREANGTPSQDSDNIYQIDLSWARSLSDHLLRLDICPTGRTPWVHRLGQFFYGANEHPDHICMNLDPDYEDVRQHFPSLLMYDDSDMRLISIPFFADIGLLYYNTTYVHRGPFDTWDDITKNIAERTSPGSWTREGEEKAIKGYVWQGEAYEALVINLLEWIGRPETGRCGVFSTDFTDPTKVLIDYARVIKAIRMAKDWIRVGISPQIVLSQNEERNLKSFKDGDVMFMRNWPRVWSEIGDKTKFSVSLLPKGGVLGGWQLGISKYSKHPEMLLNLVLYLTGQEAQKGRAIKGYLLPTIRELYNGSEQGKLDAQSDGAQGDRFFSTLAKQIRDKHGLGLQYIFDATSIVRPSYLLEGCYMEFSEAFAIIIKNALKNPWVESEVKSKLTKLGTSIQGCLGRSNEKRRDLKVERVKCHP